MHITLKLVTHFLHNIKWSLASTLKCYARNEWSHRDAILTQVASGLYPLSRRIYRTAEIMGISVLPSTPVI